jgi:hypothetical protein
MQPCEPMLPSPHLQIYCRLAHSQNVLKFIVGCGLVHLVKKNKMPPPSSLHLSLHHDQLLLGIGALRAQVLQPLQINPAGYCGSVLQVHPQPAL